MERKSASASMCRTKLINELLRVGLLALQAVKISKIDRRLKKFNYDFTVVKSINDGDLMRVFKLKNDN